MFKVSSEHKKYCNFLEGLIKIHNLSLANCLSEELERLRVDKLWHPWDHEFQPRTRKTIVLGVLEQ